MSEQSVRKEFAKIRNLATVEDICFEFMKRLPQDVFSVLKIELGEPDLDVISAYDNDYVMLVFDFPCAESYADEMLANRKLVEKCFQLQINSSRSDVKFNIENYDYNESDNLLEIDIKVSI